VIGKSSICISANSKESLSEVSSRVDGLSGNQDETSIQSSTKCIAEAHLSSVKDQQNYAFIFLTSK